MLFFNTDTCWKSSSPLVSSLIKRRLFKTALDIDEPPFQFIHTIDLSVADTTLHDSPDLVIHRTEMWTVWRPQVGRKKVWCFLTQQFNCCTCVARRGVLVHCPVGTPSCYQTLHIAGSSTTSLWCHEAASKKTVRDITRISCFVTALWLTVQTGWRHWPVRYLAVACKMWTLTKDSDKKIWYRHMQGNVIERMCK